MLTIIQTMAEHQCSKMSAALHDRGIKTDSLCKTGQCFHPGHTGNLALQIKK